MLTVEQLIDQLKSMPANAQVLVGDRPFKQAAQDGTFEKATDCAITGVETIKHPDIDQPTVWLTYSGPQARQQQGGPSKSAYQNG